MRSNELKIYESNAEEGEIRIEMNVFEIHLTIIQIFFL